MNLSIIYTSTLCLGIFAIVYLLLYRNSNKFTINRLYLIGTGILSSIIPFINFNVFPKLIEINRNIINNISENPSSINTFVASEEVSTLDMLYYSGLIISLVILLVRILFIVYKIKTNKVDVFGKYKIIKDNNASSFFNYLFVDTTKTIEQRHEEIHSDRYHSIDRLLFGVLICFNWFNPIMYIYRYLIIENHEYEADQRTIQTLNLEKSTYGNILINAIKNNTQYNQISNQFNSLIKNRIKMLSNSTSKKLSYLLLLPIVLGIFSAFTFKTYPVYTQDNKVISQDSLPGTFEVIDTVMIYDSDTGEESVTIVKMERSLEEFMQDFNNKYYTTIDTIYYYDNNTKEEGVYTNQSMIPEQLKYIYSQLNSEQLTAIYAKYSFSQTLERTVYSSDKLDLFPSETGYFLTIFREGKEITKQRVPKLTESIVVKNLNLQKGAYHIKRSDTKDIIKLTIR